MAKDLLREAKNYNIDIRENVMLNNYTTLNIGGPAKYFVFVRNIEELKKILQLVKLYNENLLIIGAGSNILVSDKGFNGVVVKLKEDFCRIKINNTTVEVFSGVMLSMLIKTVVDHSLGGLEDLFGIPGTIGGCVVMNAGVKTSTVSDFIEYIEVIDVKEPEVGIIKFRRNDINFDYRKSGLEDKYVVIKAVFNLKVSKKEKLIERINEVLLNRIKTQPLGTFNAGCIFKNPSKDISSAQLIEGCGLKGYSIGDAYISEKHANFIINRKNAKAEDFVALIRYVIKKVKEKYNIELEPEIRIVGF